MQTALVLAALVAVAVAAPQLKPNPTKPIGLLHKDEKQDAFGQFVLEFETEDGTTVTRQGSLKPTGKDGENVLVQSGSESWTSPEGIKFLLTWFADKDGYHATGDHLPVSVTPVAPSTSS